MNPQSLHLLRRAYQFEYRSARGADELAAADLWLSAGGRHAVLVLRGVPPEGAGAALRELHDSWLPYLLRPEVALVTLSVRQGEDGEKARALVLPQAV